MKSWNPPNGLPALQHRLWSSHPQAPSWSLSHLCPVLILCSPGLVLHTTPEFSPLSLEDLDLYTCLQPPLLPSMPSLPSGLWSNCILSVKPTLTVLFNITMFPSVPILGVYLPTTLFSRAPITLQKTIQLTYLLGLFLLSISPARN